MKYKSYGDSAVQNTTGLNLELLGCKDEISARNTNRPIINLYENQETNYNLIQTLLKTVYGNVQGVIPDVFEDFAPEDFSVGSFKNDTSNYYLRVPTGLFLGRKVTDNQYIHSTVDGNPFSKFGEYNYKDEIHKENFLQDALKSYIIENKPEINLYERELAKLIDLDLSDLTNDIKIGCDMIPYTYKVAIIDPQTGIQMLDSAGSPKFVVDDDSNILYKAQTGRGNYNIVGQVSRHEAVTSIEHEKEPNHLDSNALNVYTVVDGEYTVAKANGGEYTNNIKDALIITDTCDNKKYKTGYYIKVVRATSADDEVVYLPNKAENASWKVCLPALTAGEIEKSEYEVIFKDENGFEVDSFSFSVIGSATIEGINDKLYSNLLSLSTKFSGERFSQNKNSDIVNGVKIISASSNAACNNYTLTITRNGEEIRDWLREEGGEYIPLTDVEATAAVQQKYYDNIFELTNAFLGYYSSYLIKIENIYEYVNLETILKIQTINSSITYHLYYDLDANIDNAINSEYDKTGRFRLTTNTLSNDNFILLYDIKLDNTSIAPNTVQVTYVKSYLNTLDRRLIATKRAELKSLLADTRTELSNYVHIKDSLLDSENNKPFSSREIEIVDYHEDSKNNQTRITSPVLRLVDEKDDTGNDTIITTKETDNWTDSGNGDTISDFFEESTLIRDFDKEGESHYLYHNDSTNKGIIIDKNKGIRIFNNDIGETDGKHSYSSFKPIEIVSKKGNISLFTYGNNSGRINIANLTDNEKNIVDVKGITRVRSSQDGQLVVRKIAATNDENNKANIYFAVGNSYSKEDTKAKDLVNGKNINIGSINFYTGKNYLKGVAGSNVVDKNRFFSLNLSDTNASNNVNALIVRNAKSGVGKKVFTVFGDIVPNDEGSSNTIGHPLASRTYNNSDTPVTSYNEYEYISNLKVDSNGNSTEFLNDEGRWIAAFIKNGYFGHITLSDRTEDIQNKDSRSGALRLGNSNIYDVSSIYINCDSTTGNKTRENYGTINFDNSLGNNKNLTENTIASLYERNGENNGLALILYRNLEDKPSFNTKQEVESNACTAYFKPTGTEIRKNLYVQRQMFVNQHTNSSKEDNSAFVVKGQSVMQGELVVGKEAITVDTANVGRVTANKQDGGYNNGEYDSHNFRPYKLYNWEYFNSQTKKWAEDDTAETKEDILFLFRMYGRSYFDGDITINKDRRFTEDANFNRTLTIYNNNYAHLKYNEPNSTCCPSSDSRFVNSVIPDNFYTKETSKLLLPRHNTSLDVKSGLIKFGSDFANAYPNADQADVILNGSQFIRRRLEIGTSNPALFDEIDSRAENTNYSILANRLKYDGYSPNALNQIEEVDSKVTPSLYVEGGTQFNGDVVFGHKLAVDTIEDDTETGKVYTYHRLASKKADNSSDSGNGSKVIFWGNNSEEVIDRNSQTNVDRDWKSDFDFHGKTWFDNTVRIGTNPADIHKQDANDSGDRCTGSLEIWGRDSGNALVVKGSTEITDSVTSVTHSKYIKLRGGNQRGALENGNQKFAAIELNGEDIDHTMEGNYSGENTADTGYLRMVSTGATTLKAQYNGTEYVNEAVMSSDGLNYKINGQNAGLTLNVSRYKSGAAYRGINITAVDKDIIFDYRNDLSSNDSNTLNSFSVHSDNINIFRNDAQGLFIKNDDYSTLKANADNLLSLSTGNLVTLKSNKSSIELNSNIVTIAARDDVKNNAHSIIINDSSSDNGIKIENKNGNSITLGNKTITLDSNNDSVLYLEEKSSAITIEGIQAILATNQGSQIAAVSSYDSSARACATRLDLLNTNVTLQSNGTNYLKLNASTASLKGSTEASIEGNGAKITLNKENNGNGSAVAIMPNKVRFGGASSNCLIEKDGSSNLNIRGSTVNITGQTVYLGNSATSVDSNGNISTSKKVSAGEVSSSDIHGTWTSGTIKTSSFYLNGYKVSIG